MNEKLCQKIKKLRLEKGWKQEKLAEKLGLSNQAISKWETGVSLPDIESLPGLARIFNISIDELLSFQLELSENQVKVVVEKIVDKYVEKGFEEGYKYNQELIKKYPNSISLKFYAGSLFQNYLIDEEYDLEIALGCYKKAVEIYEEVLESKQEEFSYKTKQKLVGYYSILEDLDSAERVIKTISDDIPEKKLLLASLYIQNDQIEMGEIVYQEYLKNISYKQLMVMNILGKFQLEENPKAAKTINEKAMETSSILGIYEEYQLMNLIEINLLLGQEDQAVEDYERLVKIIKEKDYNLEENLLFNKTEKIENVNLTKSMTAKLVKYHPSFEQLKNKDKVKLADIELEKIIL